MVSTRWERRVDELIDDGRIERVEKEQNFLAHLIVEAHSNLSDARSLKSNGSLHGAFIMSYTSGRIAATAILYSRGVRPTARGGHWVVADLLAEIETLADHVVTSLNRLRLLRNELEYPQSISQPLTPEVVRLCFETADTLCQFAQLLLDN